MLVASTRSIVPMTPEPAADELDPVTLELCRRGDRGALERFVRCYERRVFAFLSRTLGHGLSVDDLAQEVFLRAYRALGQFEPTGRARLSTWLLTIAYRVLVDARRRQRVVYLFPSEERELTDTNDPEQQLWTRELNAALARAIAELPLDQRDTFILSEFHHLSVADIAKVTGSLEATVKTRLFRARGHLRVRLSDLWETDR
jgi:RNA polymerase sigma-70 factor (ECF subfamily)